MVKPPCNLGRAGILEIHDGVLIAIKVRFVKERPPPVQQSGKDKLHVPANALPVETRKQRRRRSSVETLVVIKDSNFQIRPFEFPLSVAAFDLPRMSREK